MKSGILVVLGIVTLLILAGCADIKTGKAGETGTQKKVWCDGGEPRPGNADITIPARNKKEGATKEKSMELYLFLNANPSIETPDKSQLRNMNFAEK